MKVIKRLPLILFLLTIVSLGYMILIRVSGSGNRLLLMDASAGRFVAEHYNSCIFLFVIVLGIFVAVTLLVNRKKRKDKERNAPVEEPAEMLENMQN